MRPVDDSTGYSSAEQALMRLVVEVGIDPADAGEVLGAVMSYCSARHGTTELNSGYLQFLTVRSACSAHGLAFTRDAVARIVQTVHPRERMLLMALVHAKDAAALFDVYRRGILYPVASSLSAHGQALRLDLRRLKANPAEDHPLAWRPVLKRVAEWITDWRQECGSIQLVLVQEGPRRLTSTVELREWLVDWVRRQEVLRSVPPAEFHWVGTD